MRIVAAPPPDQTPAAVQDVIDVLREDGLACFPGHRQYVIAASLFSESAVIRLVQSKRRSGKAPSLVFVPDVSLLAQLTDEVPAMAAPLAQAFWPGPLTLLLEPGGEIPSKVLKAMALKKSARLGVRIPEKGFAWDVVHGFSGPLLISSANISKKVGSGSASHIRKEFHHTVDVMIDAGDLPAGTPSTIVDPDSGVLTIKREGRITAERIQEVLQVAGLLPE